MKIYYGTRNAERTDVWVWDLLTEDIYMLDCRKVLLAHWPASFDWGSGGDGPAQLALALLCDVLADDGKAAAQQMSFKWNVVARLPKAGWSLSEHQIRQALATIRTVPLNEATFNVASSLKQLLGVSDDAELLAMALSSLRWKCDLAAILNEHERADPVMVVATPARSTPELGD